MIESECDLKIKKPSDVTSDYNVGLPYLKMIVYVESQH